MPSALDGKLALRLPSALDGPRPSSRHRDLAIGFAWAACSLTVWQWTRAQSVCRRRPQTLQLPTVAGQEQEQEAGTGGAATQLTGWPHGRATCLQPAPSALAQVAGLLTSHSSQPVRRHLLPPRLDATAQRQPARPLTVRGSLLQVARLLTQLIEDNRSQSEARSQIIWSQQRQLEARQKRNRLKQVCPVTKAALSAVWVLFKQQK